MPCCSNNCAAGDFYRAPRHVSGCHAAPTDLCLDASVVAPYARWALEFRCVGRCGRRRFVASRLTPRCASPNAADNQPFLTAVCHTAELSRLAVSYGGRPRRRTITKSLSRTGGPPPRAAVHASECECSSGNRPRVAFRPLNKAPRRKQETASLRCPFRRGGRCHPRA